MAEYHVGLGIAGIYAGILRSEDEWKEKTEVTHEALCAVSQYLLVQGHGVKFTYNGEPYVLKVERGQDGKN